ncbi:MAG: deoxyribodipyrimidine photo-lyase [Parachlamydiaceae bacterium]|nr:deoxyribodipyrimidine photo-lyase [Parachlamydiaceae bacterium]
MNRILFLFRRDLRIEDNTGLQFALQNAKEVIPSFIFTPEQVTHNSFRSDRCVQFMIESLKDLSRSLNSINKKLYLFYGTNEKIVEDCIKKLNIDGVAVNADYTPYSIQRDQKIEAICKKLDVPFYSFEDALLQPIDECLKKDGSPYTIFTPYYRNASKLLVKKPILTTQLNFYSSPITFAEDESVFEKVLSNTSFQQNGGRTACLERLKQLHKLSNYSIQRDFPAKNYSTHLSPHLKFGTCSVREIYYEIMDQLGKESELLRSLYWRDFFSTISYYFPHVFTGAFKEKFQSLSWKNSKNDFKIWCEGLTGFPIVDAGMRELNQTGYMHNRVRMIVASFLVKDLYINWQWGEKYFAQKLIDYDPAINNGNWQWAAGTGCDAQPYFRVFNPWTQGLKFDCDCEYIKQWVPELKPFSPKVIHEWHLEKNHSQSSTYPKPIVDHQIASAQIRKFYLQSIK